MATNAHRWRLSRRSIGSPEHGQVRVARSTPPQPQAFGDAGLAGQVLHFDQDQGAADHGFRAVAAFGRVVLGLGVHARPGAHLHPTILCVLLGVLIGGCPPGARVGAGELPAVLAWSPYLRPSRWGRIGIQAPVTPQPHQHRDPLAIDFRQLAGKRRRVIAGIEDAQWDGTAGGQVLHQLPDLRSGHRVGVATSRHALYIQRRGPTVMGQAHLRQPRVGPAGDDRLAS